MAQRIAASGAVLWRADPGLRVALVHRPRYDDWSLPKGKLERGESGCAAAVREVAEETGHACVLGAHLGRVGYPVPEGDKVVDYFAARASSGTFAPSDEVDELRWLSPELAAPLLTHDHDRAVLARFTAMPRDAVTVLLVRHGHAGKKELWEGPDDERPLSATGRRQTGALTRLLPLFGPDRVHSVPKLRCTTTVAPLASLLGVPVTAEPALSEPHHGLDPAAAPLRLAEIVAAGGTPVVCSQGGVIPDVLRALATRSGLGIGEPRSRKGSVWVLAFAPGHDGTLLSAHYVERA